MSLLLDRRASSSSRAGQRSSGDFPAGGRPRSRAAVLLHAGAAGVLFSLILWAYHPSIDHTHRSDQWCFLLETIDQDSFPAIFARTYSFSRTRKVAPGDYELFRPVLFALLSAEKALFGNNLALWQWVGIGLHCLAVYLFLHILLLIHRFNAIDPPEEGVFPLLTERRLLKGLAYGLALFLGLNFAVVDMVIWSHINGYLLFIVFALAAVWMVLKAGAEPESSPARKNVLLTGAFLLLLLSAFTFEIGQFFAVLVGVVAGAFAHRDGRLRRSLAVFVLYASILPVYQGVNWLDQLHHPATVAPSRQPIPGGMDQRARGQEKAIAADASMKTIAIRAASLTTIEYAIRYVDFTVVQPFFPSCAKWAFFTERLLIDEPFVSRATLAVDDPLLILSSAVLVAVVLLTIRGLWRFAVGRRKRQTILWVILPFSLFALHAAVVVLGRMNLRPGPRILSANSYYVYLPLLGVLTSLYVFWACPVSGGRRLSPWIVPVYAILLAGLGVLSISSGIKLHEMNLAVKTGLRPLRLTVKNLKQFLDEHAAEPDFSFAIDTTCSQVKNPHGIPVPVLLFKRFINNRNPKYVLTFTEGRLAAKRYDANRSFEQGEPHLPQLFPDLVRVDTLYNFYRFDGWYYGVQCRDGYFCPEQEDYQYLIVDATLEGARLQVKLKRDENEADLASGRFIPPSATITSVEAGFQGFDLFEAYDRIYAIPSSEGPLDPARLLHDRYTCWYCADSLAEVKNRIRSRNSRR